MADTDICCWNCKHERNQHCHKHAPIASPGDSSAWWPYIGLNWETCGDFEPKENTDG